MRCLLLPRLRLLQRFRSQRSTCTLSMLLQIVQEQQLSNILSAIDERKSPATADEKFIIGLLLDGTSL